MSDSGPHPIELSKHHESRSLVVHWSDGVQQSIKFRKLRDCCPCAHCVDKRTRSAEPQSDLPNAEPEKPKSLQLNVLSANQLKPLDISAMKPVGNYAYNIEFSDGHSSGLYPFAFLRSLGAAEGGFDSAGDDPGINNPRASG